MKKFFIMYTPWQKGDFIKKLFKKNNKSKTIEVLETCEIFIKKLAETKQYYSGSFTYKDKYESTREEARNILKLFKEIK